MTQYQTVDACEKTHTHAKKPPPHTKTKQKQTQTNKQKGKNKNMQKTQLKAGKFIILHKMVNVQSYQLTYVSIVYIIGCSVEILVCIHFFYLCSVQHGNSIQQR